ncbi:MAG: hypothetical protein P8L85_12450 [Rubripirellula sp.]|nr:hypothetical protein [Rubripirellula sp.]
MKVIRIGDIGCILVIGCRPKPSLCSEQLGADIPAVATAILIRRLSSHPKIFPVIVRPRFNPLIHVLYTWFGPPLKTETTVGGDLQ